MSKYSMADYEKHEEMTVDEIIANLKYLDRGYIGSYNFSGTELDLERYKMHSTIRNAINLLEDMTFEE